MEYLHLYYTNLAQVAGMPIPHASELPRAATVDADCLAALHGEKALAVARADLIDAINSADNAEMERRASICFVLMGRR